MLELRQKRKEKRRINSWQQQLAVCSFLFSLQCFRAIVSRVSSTHLSFRAQSRNRIWSALHQKPSSPALLLPKLRERRELACCVISPNVEMTEHFHTPKGYANLKFPWFRIAAGSSGLNRQQRFTVFSLRFFVLNTHTRRVQFPFGQYSKGIPLRISEALEEIQGCACGFCDSKKYLSKRRRFFWFVFFRRVKKMNRT